MRLIEIAPGIDLEKDILNQMDFEPVISDNLKEMDPKNVRRTLGEIKRYCYKCK